MRRNATIFTKLIHELGLQNNEAEIKTKASELQREVDRKIDSKLMTHWPSCKPALCTHIACEILKVPFDKPSLVKLASTTEQNYNSSLSYVKKTLNISTLTFDLLVTRFGCPKTLPYLETMFEVFKNNWTQELTSANLKTIDWDNCIFKVAIFWCVCKAFGGQNQITQQEIINLPEVTTTRHELNKHVKLVDTHCKSYIAELKSQKKYPGRRITFQKPKPLKKKAKPKKDDDGEDKTDDDKTVRGMKRKFQDEDEESNNKDETRAGKTLKSIDKGKKRAVEPEEEESCIGPGCSHGEMKIVNYWETQTYKDYLAWREIITQKILEKMEEGE